MCDYLDDNRSVLAFRRSVPSDLRPFILNSKGNPRTEWRFSLHTNDRRKAIELCHQEVVTTDAAIRKAELARDAWLAKAAQSPQQRAQQDRQWEAEREAGELRSREDFLEHAAFEEGEPLRQALIAKLGR